MPVELLILALGGLLLLVHIFTAIHFKTRQYGVEWNMSARDGDQPPLDAVAGRLARAQTNYQETLPLAIIALLGVVVAGRTSEMSAIGGWVWLGARAVYLPLYWSGVPKLRTLVFLISIVGLLIVLWPLLFG